MPNSPVCRSGCQAEYKALQARAIYTAGIQQKTSPDNSSTTLIAFNSHLFDGFHYSKNMQKSVKSEEENVEGCSTLITLFKVILPTLLLIVKPTPSFH